MNEKHTPGPWEAKWNYSAGPPHEHGVLVMRALGKLGESEMLSGRVIAKVPEPTSTSIGGQCEANARLIAKAPEMLELLKRMVTDIEVETKKETYCPSCQNPVAEDLQHDEDCAVTKAKAILKELGVEP